MDAGNAVCCSERYNSCTITMIIGDCLVFLNRYVFIANLYKKGAHVVYESLEKIHVSGHACQEEHKIMLTGSLNTTPLERAILTINTPSPDICRRSLRTSLVP